MKRILFSMIAATCLFADSGALDGVKKEIEALPGLKNFNTKILDIKEIDQNWYAIKGVQDTQQGKRTFDAFSNKKLIIIGNGFDLETGKTINIKTDFAKFKDTSAYTIGNGSKEYFLVTDPECPYCIDLEEKLPILKDDAKIYVYLTGDIIQSHIASKGIVYYIESLPKEKRATETRAIMLEKNRAVTLKKIDKFNSSMYQMMLTYKNNPEAKAIMEPYFKDLETAFNVKLDTPEAQEKFLKDKIAANVKSISDDLEKNVQNKKDIISMYFKTNGTPSVYTMDGQKLNNQFEMFNGINKVNINKIKEMAQDKELSVTAGKIGAKKAYYFIGTECSACKQHYTNKDSLKKLLENYEVHFFLALNGSNPQKAQKELMYIYSLATDSEKFKVLDSLMDGKQLQPEELNKTYDAGYVQKIAKYLNKDMADTLVDGTPSILDENGKSIR